MNDEKEIVDSSTDIIFCVTDELGVEHKLRMLTIFTAGAMKREYVAGITCDVLIYGYEKTLVNNEDREFIFEISNEVEYAYALEKWESLLEKGIDEQIRIATVYMSMQLDDGESADIPVSGSVFGIFKTNFSETTGQKYIAICPQNIMFYRYTEDKDNIIISQIYSQQEYDDITDEFHEMIVRENE